MKLLKFTDEKILVETLKTPHALEAYAKLEIGAQMKHARQKSRMTQKELAFKFHTSQSVIARMEAGKQNFSIETLVRLSLLLGKKLYVKIQ